jgi:hypothetical protein
MILVPRVEEREGRERERKKKSKSFLSQDAIFKTCVALIRDKGWRMLGEERK